MWKSLSMSHLRILWYLNFLAKKANLFSSVILGARIQINCNVAKMRHFGIHFQPLCISSITTGVLIQIISSAFSSTITEQNSYLKFDLVIEAQIAKSASHFVSISRWTRCLRLFLRFTLRSFPWHFCPRIIVFFVTGWSSTWTYFCSQWWIYSCWIFYFQWIYLR